MNPNQTSSSQPPQAQATPQPNNSSGQSEQFSTKVFKPRTLGIILLAAVTYTASSFVPIVSSLVWLVVTIMTWQFVSSLKSDPADKPLKSTSDKVTFFMGFNPVIAQAIFYYRLRKTHPVMAKAYNRFGLKVFGLEILLPILVLVAIGFIHG